VAAPVVAIMQSGACTASVLGAAATVVAAVASCVPGRDALVAAGAGPALLAAAWGCMTHSAAVAACCGAIAALAVSPSERSVEAAALVVDAMGQWADEEGPVVEAACGAVAALAPDAGCWEWMATQVGT
jgi:hypothetical protein